VVAGVPALDGKNAMVCHITEGELQIDQDGKTFTAKKNFVWTCNKNTSARYRAAPTVGSYDDGPPEASAPNRCCRNRLLRRDRAPQQHSKKGPARHGTDEQKTPILFFIFL
jgi:hypothetical protein